MSKPISADISAKEHANDEPGSSGQLPLRLSSQPQPTLDNFIEAGQGVVKGLLRGFINNPVETVLYISGEQSSGKTHLLLAVLEEFGEGQACYLPLSDLLVCSPELLYGMEARMIICLDDIDVVSSSYQWQQALFHLFNRCQSSRCKWLVAGSQPPLNLRLKLADLRSRLAWGVSVRLAMLSDSQRLQVLGAQAQHFGLKLSDDVLQFIMKRSSRDLGSLTALLYQLEQASLREQRQITIPFIKSELGW